MASQLQIQTPSGKNKPYTAEQRHLDELKLVNLQDQFMELKEKFEKS